MAKFPFGSKVKPLAQTDKTPKRVFVLGVYASAVHARWVGPDGRTIVTALAVASEPEIFWCGEGADDIVGRIPVPDCAGRLTAAGGNLNGPSGRALDERFLDPLGVTRADAWLCDLLPESRKNARQAAALERSYDKKLHEWRLPKYDWPLVPQEIASQARRDEIEVEIQTAKPDVLITLGDQPLQWFARHFGSHEKLATYGQESDTYGCLHAICIAGRRMHLLPLVHPRQAGKLGAHSQKWAALHEHWVKSVAPGLLHRRA